MNMLKSAASIGAAQLSKILLGLFLIKTIALYLGPEGLGRLGHLISLAAFLSVIAGGGIQNAVIKYVADYKDKPVHLARFVSESATYSLIFSLFLLFFLGVFSREIAFFLFSDVSLFWTIIALGFFQAIMAFNKLVTSVANGFKDTKVFAISQVSGNILSIPLIWLLVYQYGFIGGIFSILINLIVIFFPSFYFYKKSFFWNVISIKPCQYKNFGKLYRYSLMSLISSVSVPAVEIFIRQMMIDGSGLEQTGIWQAALKISSVYISFFGLFAAYYFVPSVSPIKDIQILRNTVWKYSLLVGASFGLGAIIFYIARNFFIPLLLSNEFLSLSKVIHLQLIGDFFRVLIIVIGFVFVAKAAVWFYIAIEIFQGIILVFFTSFLYKADPNIHSIFYGYILTNISLLIIVLFSFYIYIRPQKFTGNW